MSIRIGIGLKVAPARITPIPTGLTLTGISGGVQIDWTDNSSGTAQTEIWGQSNGAAYALLYTIAAGTVTKNDIIAPVDLRYYKIRALRGGLYSAFTSEVSIALLSNISLTGWTNYPGYAYETFTQSGNLITSAINTAGGGACYSNAIGAVLIGQKFILTYTMILNSGTQQFIYIGDGTSLFTRSNYVHPSNGSHIGIFTITANGLNNHLTFETGLACNFSISAISLKKILFP